LRWTTHQQRTAKSCGPDPPTLQGNRIWIWKAIALICKKDSEDGSRITEIVGWANS
jgi:hypothetical protein